MLDAAASFDLPTAALACLLTCSGCRLSEALELTRFQLDLEACAVIFFTLKRRQLHYRAVPIPQDLMAMLLVIAESRPGESRLWVWCGQTGWRRVKAVMAAAGIEGPMRFIRKSWDLRHRRSSRAYKRCFGRSRRRRVDGASRAASEVGSAQPAHPHRRSLRSLSRAIQSFAGGKPTHGFSARDFGKVEVKQGCHAVGRDVAPK